MKQQIFIRFNNSNRLCYLCKKVEKNNLSSSGICIGCYQRLYKWMSRHEHTIINKEVLLYIYKTWKIKNNLLPK